MKLAIFNGSPRKKKSNSTLLINQFLNGYAKIHDEVVPVHYIAKRNKTEEMLQEFRDAEIVLIIFPLYTDCMPGIVKEFIEDINRLTFSKPKKIGFIVQSGFPEAIHSTFVERYLQKLTQRLGCEYLGTVIKGGVEGIQIMPPQMTKKLFGRFHELGKCFAENNSFSPEIVGKLRHPYKMSMARRIGFSLIRLTGLTNYYWNSNLKKHGAYQNRFDRPFIDEN